MIKNAEHFARIDLDLIMNATNVSSAKATSRIITTKLEAGYNSEAASTIYRTNSYTGKSQLAKQTHHKAFLFHKEQETQLLLRKRRSYGIAWNSHAACLTAIPDVEILLVPGLPGARSEISGLNF